ncbi:MAG: phosphotransferase [Chloroflexi bacterium]|nr:phosphotransferase [Chloroflexota bacterium]
MAGLACTIEQVVSNPLELAGAGSLAAVPPAAALRVADELVRRYRLGNLLRAEVAYGGLLNQNLVATSARGSYFLKGYRYADPAPIAREHRLIAFVAEQGLPAVAPLSTPGGATFLRAGGRYWAVFPLLADRQIAPEDFSVGMAASLGAMLGSLHTALAKLPALECARFPARLLWDSRRAVAEMGDYESEIRRRPALDPFDQHALASFAYRRSLLAGGGAPPPEAFASLPAQVLHGDFHEGNLFFAAGGTISGIIDWELACIGPRCWEVIRTLDYALQLPKDFASGGARLKAFLHAYLAEAPLTYDECVVMPELYWAYRVHSLWVYEEHYRKGSAKTDRLAMEDIPNLEWWLRNRNELALALADILRSAPQTRLVTS